MNTKSDSCARGFAAGLKACIGGAFALAAAACASAPLNLSGADSVDTGLVAVSAQEDLRSAAGALRAHAENRGWRLDDRPAMSAFLGRLVGGGGEAERPSEAVDAYLARIEGREGSELAGDAVRAESLGIEVAAAIDVIVAARAPLGEQGLRRDLAEAEGALTTLTRARSFFNEVFRTVEADLSGADQQTVMDALDRLDAAVERLEDASDALAERRWAAAGEEPPVS